MTTATTPVSSTRPARAGSAVRGTFDGDPRRYEYLTKIRLEDPQAVARAAKGRRRHPGPVLGRQKIL